MSRVAKMDTGGQSSGKLTHQLHLPPTILFAYNVLNILLRIFFQLMFETHSVSLRPWLERFKTKFYGFYQFNFFFTFTFFGWVVGSILTFQSHSLTQIYTEAQT